jgi:hypothetical protein
VQLKTDLNQLTVGQKNDLLKVLGGGISLKLPENRSYLYSTIQSVDLFSGSGYLSLCKSRGILMNCLVKSPKKTVHVVRHPRFRNGNWEDVCQHYRSLPN